MTRIITNELIIATDDEEEHELSLLPEPFFTISQQVDTVIMNNKIVKSKYDDDLDIWVEFKNKISRKPVKRN